MRDEVLKYLADGEQRFVGELSDFLKIPSVSADPAFDADTRHAAQWVRQQLTDAGLATEIIETAGHPVVYGEWLQAEGAPTVLVYGHYDVQPPDPLEEWVSPPFEPTVRGEHIYARGATDDKGQMLTHVKSVEAWLKSVRQLPVNVKFVIEGEEEVGSDNLELVLKQHAERMRADVAVISDTSQYGPDLPAITYGLRGILACEVILRGPSQDLHSGVFGGSVTNPANALAKMIAGLHDANGRVQIPGFYDDVRPLTVDERQMLADLPFDEAQYVKSLGISATAGENGFTTLERRSARPTCDVNGMTSGYQGVGPKTIVPARASVKISCRLVPDQNAAQLTDNLRSYFEENLPPGLQMEFKTYHGCEALVFERDSPWMTAARSAIAQAFGRPPVFIREGGSIPVVATFREILGIDTLLLGWGQNTDNLHSPNERFSLKDFQRGILASAHLWSDLATVTTGHGAQ